MATSNFYPFDVVTVPFPFTDKDYTKKRPAVVLSNSNFNQQSGHCLLAMITSAKNSAWPLDCPVQNLKAAGLPAPSVVRFKLFTLDSRFILDSLGSLSATDRKAVQKSLRLALQDILA